jgi:hypothetical protein
MTPRRPLGPPPARVHPAPGLVPGGVVYLGRKLWIVGAVIFDGLERTYVLHDGFGTAFQVPGFMVDE